MRIIKISIFAAMSLLLFSCASTTQVSFLCSQEDLEIYVNDDYIGKGLVHYVAPKGVTTANVECKKDGVTIYTRNYYIKGHNREMFDLIVPDHQFYSSDRQVHSK